MANPIETAYAGLKEELVIGPSHHRFQLISKQREHFMGSLWLAEDISTAARTEVSLLILRPELVRHDGVADQMRKLVTKLRSALRHPHIATCYGYFSWRGLEFMSLEHLDGQTLSDLFQRNQARKLNDRQKQGLLIQLAKAVDSGQLKLGKPHSLLAPDLVFLNAGGGVKLTGFGWRSILDPLLTLLPKQPDYPSYQAPEAFHPQNQTARSDVYALALIAWELYSGKRAFQPADGEAARYRKEFKSPGGLNKAQWSSLSCALSPETEPRPASCMALVRELFATETSPEQSTIPDMRSESPGETPRKTPAVEPDPPAATAIKQAAAEVQPTPTQPAPTTERPGLPAADATDDAVVVGEPASDNTENSVGPPPEELPQSEAAPDPEPTSAPEPQPVPKPEAEPDAETIENTPAAKDKKNPTPEQHPHDGANDAEQEPETGTGSLITRLRSLTQLPEPVRRWSRRGLIFALGFVAGFWLALLFYQGQLDAISSQALTQMKNNRELRAAFESLELAHQRQQQELDRLHTAAEQPTNEKPSAGVESASALREANRPVDNLTLFQDELQEGGRGPQMAVIPAGRFRMGDLHGNGDDNERPVHEVLISSSFALARHEVTFEEYDRFANATGRPLPDDEGWGRGTRPVINVSWNDANAYTRWLAEQTGQPYRLPTEAEWEYSARAGTESIYWWGNQPGQGYAVCDGCDTQWGGQQTAPVGSMKPNPWGLHDMSGNVDEWVLDCYQPDYSNAPNDGSATRTSDCTHRVMRGGSWFDIPRVARPASRYRHPATSSRNSWGFRVALDLPASMQ
jgi:formylglycine-generating enzyme required for sulfatase activity/serine/threonine protein kinase